VKNKVTQWMNVCVMQAMYLPWVLVLFNMIIAGGYVTPFQTNILSCWFNCINASTVLYFLLSCHWLWTRKAEE